MDGSVEHEVHGSVRAIDGMGVVRQYEHLAAER